MSGVAKHVDLLFQFLMSDEKILESLVTDWKNDFERELITQCLAFWNCQIEPMCSFFWGIIAQEIVKYTGKFTPINQWLIHEFYSTCNPGISVENMEAQLSLAAKYASDPYRDQIILFGEKARERLKNTRVFLVGAGGLGCEFLKSFALLGVGSGEEGFIAVADDDTIELSNLNRQFLFRREHLNKFKALIAAKSAEKINPSLKLRPFPLHVNESSESTFTDNFFDSISFIVNAVDNVQARRYIDSKAVLHRKVVFESGTLGAKCSTQVIVPDKTESYSDSDWTVDPAVPVGVPRRFPYLIEHCIEWARQLFFSEFVRPYEEVLGYLGNPDQYFMTQDTNGQNDVLEKSEQIRRLDKAISLILDQSVDNMILYVRRMFDNCFDLHIKKLLLMFPKDHRDKKGNIFWASPKRCPRVVKFNPDNENHVQFLVAGVTILCQIFRKEEIPRLSREKIKQVFENYTPMTLVQLEEREEALTNDRNTQVQRIKSQLADLSPQIKVSLINFEKDDDSLKHIDFVSLSSNFRGENFKIRSVPKYKTRLIAGNIVPALATTSAMTVGALGMEMLKHLGESPFSSFRNFSANLAISKFNFFEPSPPKVKVESRFDEQLMEPVKSIPEGSNTWSRVDVTGEALKVKDVVSQINGKLGIKVDSLETGEIVLWTAYGMGGESFERDFVEVYEESTGTKVYGAKYLVCKARGRDSSNALVVPPPVICKVTRPEKKESPEKSEEIKENSPKKEPKTQENKTLKKKGNEIKNQPKKRGMIKTASRVIKPSPSQTSRKGMKPSPSQTSKKGMSKSPSTISKKGGSRIQKNKANKNVKKGGTLQGKKTIKRKESQTQKKMGSTIKRQPSKSQIKSSKNKLRKPKR